MSKISSKISIVDPILTQEELSTTLVQMESNDNTKAESQVLSTLTNVDDKLESFKFTLPFPKNSLVFTLWKSSVTQSSVKRVFNVPAPNCRLNPRRR